MGDPGDQFSSSDRLIVICIMFSELFLLTDPERMDEVKYLVRVWASVVKFFLQQSENYQYVVFGAKTEQKGSNNFDTLYGSWIDTLL